MKILNSAQIRATEAHANACGISFERMMETAGFGCANNILCRYPKLNNIVILIGKGKNGGDGYVCARYLAAAGKTVTLIRLFSEKSDPLSEKMRDLLPTCVQQLYYTSNTSKAESSMRAAEIIVDAVFGIGFRGRFPETVSACIGFANNIKAVRIAIDLPSGVGEFSDESIPFKAHVTLSMLCLKKEQVYSPHRAFCGLTEVIPIGIDCDESQVGHALTFSEAAAMLPPRPFDANKGTFGNVMIFGGSHNMPGAPILAAGGALRSGAGIVTMAIPEDNLTAASVVHPECVFLPLKTDKNGFLSADSISVFIQNADKYAAVVLGNGMGQTEEVRTLVAGILKAAKCPVVLDADGINAVCSNMNILKETNVPLLLTPHPGEMSRLTGLSIAEINANREELAAAFAKEHGVYILLKGANTILADPSGNIYVNPTGSAALARGGSGDVLAGILGALLSQKMNAFDALRLAAFIHGRAGELSEIRCSSYSSTTQENTLSVSAVFRELIKGL